MSNISSFDSRTGKIDFSSETVYNFISDIRNLERFVPSGSLTDLKLTKESASFRINMLGDVNLDISEKIPGSKVVFTGNAMQQNNFTLFVFIGSAPGNNCSVNVRLTAELNPMLRMMAADPIQRFLDTLISEMEKYQEWEKTIEGNQPL